jgi:hypothetical protein
MNQELYQLKAFLMGCFLTWVYLKPKKSEIKEIKLWRKK